MRKQRQEEQHRHEEQLCHALRVWNTEILPNWDLWWAVILRTVLALNVDRLDRLQRQLYCHNSHIEIIIRSWYTVHWWVGCYIWYSEEGPGQGSSPPRPLLAVPNATAHPSTDSVPITVLLYDGTLLCGFNEAIKGFRVMWHCCSSAYHGALQICLWLWLWLSCWWDGNERSQQS